MMEGQVRPAGEARPHSAGATFYKEGGRMHYGSAGRIVSFVLLFMAGVSFADDNVPARVTRSALNDHLYQITCTAGEEFGLEPFGTNLVASVGPDGMLLIDAGFESTGAEVAESLRTLYDGPRKIVINTHSHGDHAGGNMHFLDAVIMAQRNAVDQLSGNYYHLPGKPGGNRPMIGFGDTLVVHINGEEVRMVHAPACHTGGDVYAYFTDSKIVAVGDLFFSDEFPFIDLNAGGSVAGYIDQIQRFIDDFPDDVTFIAAHGRHYAKPDLVAYKEMLTGTADAVRRAVAEGKSTQQMIDDSLLAGWAAWEGSFPTTTTPAWIATIVFEAARPDMLMPSICEPLTKTLVAGTGDDAVVEYHRLKSEAPDAYNFDEAQLNMLGYQLMFRSRLDDALAIFRLNIDAYPESSNVYDSYGEALLAAGDTASAIINYTKSLELNPANTNAAAVLEKLR